MEEERGGIEGQVSGDLEGEDERPEARGREAGRDRRGGIDDLGARDPGDRGDRTRAPRRAIAIRRIPSQGFSVGGPGWWAVRRRGRARRCGHLQGPRQGSRTEGGKVEGRSERD